MPFLFQAGEGGCKKGVCTQRIVTYDMTVEFQHLGIQCKRKRDVQAALEERKSIRVDPFDQGFQHASSPSTIDLNAVRLCFQAFLEDPLCPGKFTTMVPPVCSKPIFDAKAKKELQIMEMSDNCSPAKGGKKIIILCERVSRDDIKVRFFQKNPKWEAFGIFKPEDVHRQYAICLLTPPYLNPCLGESKKVWVELTKQDKSSSEPVEFSFTPNIDKTEEESKLANPCPTIISMLRPKPDLMPDMESLQDDLKEAAQKDTMMVVDDDSSSSKPNPQIYHKGLPASIIIPSPKVRREKNLFKILAFNFFSGSFLQRDLELPPLPAPALPPTAKTKV